MADKILHKRNLSEGALPTTASLDVGELAINVADGKVHLRKSGSASDTIVSLVTANTITTGSIEVTNGFTGSLFGTSSWAQNAVTASYYNELDPVFTSVSASYATTSSLNSFTASYIQDSSSFDSRISTNSSSISALSSSFISFSASYNTGSFTGTFTGSFFGTASWAQNAITSSYTLTAETASYVNPLRQNVIITGSLLVTQSHISTVDYIDFTVTANSPFQEGRIQWIDDTKTLNVDTDVNNFSIEVGHQNVVRARNVYNFTLTKGTIVYINGESGNRPTIATASWTGDTTSAGVIGWIVQDIAANGTGYVLTSGILRGVNTNAFAPGTRLFLSSSGQYTNLLPPYPFHEVRLGQTITQGVNGSVFVNIMNGYEIDELHDVNLTSSSYGDVLMYSGSGWINSKQLSGSYQLTGSLNVQGTITSSLFGTASWAQNAVTASYILNAVSASFATSASHLIGGVPSPFPFTGDAVVTGSVTATTGFTGSLFGTSSWAVNAEATYRTGFIGQNAYYVPVTVDNATTNGNNLRAAYAYAKTATPSGSALAIGNRFTIFLPPGIYNMTTTLTIDTNFIDIVGMSGDHAAAVITSTTVSPVTVTSAVTDYQLRSLTIENNANSNSIYCIVIPTGFRYQEYWYNLKFQYGTNAGVNTRIHIHSRNFSGRYERIYLETRKTGTGTTYPTQYVIMNLFGAEHRTNNDTATGTLDGTFTDISFAPNINNDVGAFFYVAYEFFNFATLSGTFSNIHLAMHIVGTQPAGGPNIGRIRFADRITTATGYFNNISYTDNGSVGMEFFGFNAGTLSGTFQNFRVLSRGSIGLFGDATSVQGETLSGTFSDMTIRVISNGNTRGIFNSQTLSGNFTNIHIITNTGCTFGGEKDNASTVLSGTFINCGVIITGANITSGQWGAQRNKTSPLMGVCSGYFKDCYHRITGAGATVNSFAGSTHGDASGYFEDCEISCAGTISEFRPFGGTTGNGFTGTMMGCRLQSTWPSRVSGQIFRSDFFASAATASAITNLLTGSKLAYCRAVSTGGTASMQGTTSSFYLCSFNVAPTNPNLITTPYNVIDVNI